ncbi:hypothetical protein BDV59DRAFT_201045 [Aspergillus ambiguus]|uniref:putative mating locus protein n=1 Tax=Aspergillus ambiguus TaxID=176160 RepID=UPI003CCE3441
MDTFTVALLMFLNAVSQDAGVPPQKRELSTYIRLTFSAHKNAYRLMAQVSDFMAGEIEIHPSHRANVTREAGMDAVHLKGRYMQAILSDFRVTPTIADLEGHPIELISVLDPSIDRSLKGANRFRFHKSILAMEKKANEDLARCTQKYGYHYIFRAGLQQYYMTKAVVENVNFWRPDARGNQYRANVQKLSYDAHENRVHLNDAEKRHLIQVMNCFPADAYRFWHWLEKSRISYNAMKACIWLLEGL